MMMDMKSWLTVSPLFHPRVGSMKLSIMSWYAEALRVPSIGSRGASPTTEFMDLDGCPKLLAIVYIHIKHHVNKIAGQCSMSWHFLYIFMTFSGKYAEIQYKYDNLNVSFCIECSL